MEVEVLVHRYFWVCFSCW